jgi:ribosomal-protein-serine acetyltransferase
MEPLLIDIPTEFTTERLVIRAPRPGEGAVVNAAIVDSITELKPWMPWAQTVPTIEESETHARRAHARFHAREDLTYRAWLKGSDTFIVGSGLHRMDWLVPKFEIGYWVCTPFVGQGFASEVVAALAQLAFETLGAQRVEIRMDDRNERSRKVAEQTGFTLEGVLRRDCRDVNGDLCDTRVYSRVRPVT